MWRGGFVSSLVDSGAFREVEVTGGAVRPRGFDSDYFAADELDDKDMHGHVVDQPAGGVSGWLAGRFSSERVEVFKPGFVCFAIMSAAKGSAFAFELVNNFSSWDCAWGWEVIRPTEFFGRGVSDGGGGIHDLGAQSFDDKIEVIRIILSENVGVVKDSFNSYCDNFSAENLVDIVFIVINPSAVRSAALGFPFVFDGFFIVFIFRVAGEDG